VLVMRETTERPEGIQAGVAKLVGTSRDKIIAEVSRLLSDPKARQRMVRSANPNGDGQAADRIAAALIRANADLAARQRPRSRRIGGKAGFLICQSSCQRCEKRHIVHR
jgi:UDP-N-acetylglucosamine 2-epimerase